MSDLPHSAGIEPVPLFESVGHVEFRLDAEEGKAAHEDGRGRDAVNVVIAVDYDALALIERGSDSPGRLDQLGPHGRVFELLQAGTQEGADVGRIAEPAVEQDLRGYAAHPHSSGEFVGPGLLGGNVPTLFHVHRA